MQFLKIPASRFWWILRFAKIYEAQIMNQTDMSKMQYVQSDHPVTWYPRA